MSSLKWLIKEKFSSILRLPRFLPGTHLHPRTKHGVVDVAMHYDLGGPLAIECGVFKGGKIARMEANRAGRGLTGVEEELGVDAVWGLWQEGDGAVQALEGSRVTKAAQVTIAYWRPCVRRHIGKVRRVLAKQCSTTMHSAVQCSAMRYSTAW